MTRLVWELVGILAAIVAAFLAFQGGKYVGGEDAKLEAKAAERDAVVRAVDEANAQARKDAVAALAAERKRADARVAASARSSALRESIRTEYVYRDPDCVLPAADLVRINAAIAGTSGANAAGSGNGPVRPAPAPENRNDRGDSGQPVASRRAVGGVQLEASRAGEVSQGE